MGIFNDLLGNIEFKGGKINVLIKTIVSISISAVAISFVIGQFKANHLSKLNDIEKLAKEGLEKNIQLENKIDEKFTNLEARIDKVYVDGVNIFEEYREFNNKQLELIIDYGDNNKELLKKILEVNSKEKSFELKSNITQSENTEKLPKKIIIIDQKTNKKIYKILGASVNYLDTLNLNKFELVSKNKSENYEEKFDYIYKEK